MDTSSASRPDPLPDDDALRDPVRRRRHEIARWTAVANRAGYALYGVAIVLFVLAFVAGWGGGFATAITVCLVLGSVLLAPAIVLGYAIKAAEREDTEVERRRNNGRGRS